ncbi:hypothetical protein NDU88_001718 [Pleurodeles waltl]|uniref:Uncharacterized protein n=1 Tax=Pleurodeles waltl TaxID=8319 RepID=A0AAV7MLR0_PLEWA|nr:hypothetical protein NDU88_001718 [Pleurodeles waltl]
MGVLRLVMGDGVLRPRLDSGLAPSPPCVQHFYEADFAAPEDESTPAERSLGQGWCDPPPSAWTVNHVGPVAWWGQGSQLRGAHLVWLRVITDGKTWHFATPEEALEWLKRSKAAGRPDLRKERGGPSGRKKTALQTGDRSWDQDRWTCLHHSDGGVGDMAGACRDSAGVTTDDA